MPHANRDTQREGGPVRTEARTGVILPQAKECPGLPEVGRGRKEPLLEFLRELNCQHLDF